ncbi:hypothetical protein R83H12_02537 [Fibrobacteria bacterium R8-3-H12]
MGLPRTAVAVGLGSEPEQESLINAFTEAIGSVPNPNDRLVIIDNNTEWIFGNAGLWQFLSTAEIDLATQDNAGLVQHSALDGCVGYYVAGVGQGNAANIANLQTQIDGKQNKLNGTAAQFVMGNGSMKDMLANKGKVDFDTLTETGMYNVTGNSNAPTGNTTRWTVSVFAGTSGNDILQIAWYYSNTNTNVYWRRRQRDPNSSESYWLGWNKFVTDVEINAKASSADLQAEASARAAADSNLQTQIDGKQNKLITVAPYNSGYSGWKLIGWITFQKMGTALDKVITFSLRGGEQGYNGRQNPQSLKAAFFWDSRNGAANSYMAQQGSRNGIKALKDTDRWRFVVNGTGGYSAGFYEVDDDGYFEAATDSVAYNPANYANADYIRSLDDFTGTASQFIKGDGSLDSNTYIKDFVVNLNPSSIAVGTSQTGYYNVDSSNNPRFDGINMKYMATFYRMSSTFFYAIVTMFEHSPSYYPTIRYFNNASGAQGQWSSNFDTNSIPNF